MPGTLLMLNVLYSYHTAVTLFCVSVISPLGNVGRDLSWLTLATGHPHKCISLTNLVSQSGQTFSFVKLVLTNSFVCQNLFGKSFAKLANQVRHQFLLATLVSQFGQTNLGGNSCQPNLSANLASQSRRQILSADLVG